MCRFMSFEDSMGIVWKGANGPGTWEYEHDMLLYFKPGSGYPCIFGTTRKSHFCLPKYLTARLNI
jgi:hypothetical protein